jgi:hypothetical protein
MKKIINLLIFFTVLSCVTPKEFEELTFIPRKESFFGIDFTKYSEKGFLITPEKYLGDYESIGLITYEYLPAAEYKLAGIIENPNFDRRDNSSGPEFIHLKKWDYEKVMIEQVMDSVFLISTRLGADALVNFRIEPKAEFHGTGYKNPTTVNGYSISGFAIKRK